MIAPKPTLKRLAGGLAAAGIGSVVVFGLMVLMNGLTEPPEKPELGDQQHFEVSKESDPPKKPKPEPDPEPQKQSSPDPPAPPPDLGSGIGTMGFDMPSFSPENATEATEELVGDVESSAMTADTVDERPKPMRRVDPKLPRSIVEKQMEGRVVVKALVDTEGRVTKIRIVESEPEGAFDRPVRRAVKRWRFRPARYEGKPVKTWIELPFEFELG